MLVPATASMGMWRSSSARMTPMWAAPRAPPPLSTRPMRGRSAPGSRACSSAAAHPTPGSRPNARPANNTFRIHIRIAPDDVAAILANEAVHPARPPGRMIRRTPANLVAVTENPHSCRRSRHRSRREAALAVALVVAAFAAPDAVAAASSLEEVVVTATRRPEPVLDVPLSIGRVGPETIQLVDSTHHAEAAESRGRSDDPARQRPGEPDGDPFASAHRRRIVRRVPVPRERRADPAGRILQRQRALRGQHRAGAGDRGAARTRQRAVRLERHARHRQRDPAIAGRAAAARLGVDGGPVELLARQGRGSPGLGRHEPRRRGALRERRRLAGGVRLPRDEGQCRADQPLGHDSRALRSRRDVARPADGRVHHRQGRV